MRRRRHVRTTALVLLIGVVMSACDTNDGREMREPHPDQELALQNTTPSTTSTTTTLPPPSTPGPSTSLLQPAAASAGPTAEETLLGTAGALGVGSDAAGAPSTGAPPSAASDGSLEQSGPIDTFAESLGVANLAVDGLEFTGPWPNGGEIATQYTCNGEDQVPLVTWTAPPAGTVELALVVVDETADAFSHWIVIGMPPEAGSVGGSEPVTVGTEANNSAGFIGWTGPCPPDTDVHTYRFTLYALDQAIELPPDSNPGDLIQAIQASATGAASFTGTYQVA